MRVQGFRFEGLKLFVFYGFRPEDFFSGIEL